MLIFYYIVPFIPLLFLDRQQYRVILKIDAVLFLETNQIIDHTLPELGPVSTELLITSFLPQYIEGKKLLFATSRLRFHSSISPFLRQW